MQECVCECIDLGVTTTLIYRTNVFPMKHINITQGDVTLHYATLHYHNIILLIICCLFSLAVLPWQRQSVRRSLVLQTWIPYI